MASNAVPINGEVLDWALKDGGFSVSEFAAKVGKVSPAVVDSWIVGDSYPTKGQFTRLVNVLRRPTSIFFLPSAPNYSSFSPQLRTARGRESRQLEIDELQKVRRARRLQKVIRSLVVGDGQPRVVIPPITMGSDPAGAGRVLRDWLSVSIETQLAWDTDKQALDGWRSAFENRGISVLQLQLGKGDLRGFSLTDDYAPVVVVNTAESLPARVFTLNHELAHLASSTESACLPVGIRPSAQSTVERWAEKVASAVLLPHYDLVKVVDQVVMGGRVANSHFDLVRRVADRFNVSLRATAVAMIRADLLDRSAYDEIEEAAPLSDRDKGFARSSGGQRAPQRRLSELGFLPSRTILNALEKHQLTELEARRFLHLGGREIGELSDALKTAG